MRTYIFSDLPVRLVPNAKDKVCVPESRGAVVPSDAPVRHANRPSGMRIAAELIEHERLEERKIELIVEYF